MKNKKGLLSEDPKGLSATTQCQRCINYHGYSKDANNATCKAFPEGIPDKYLFDEEPHDKVDPLQNGLYIYTEKK